jgi:hypothetical protein
VAPRGSQECATGEVRLHFAAPDADDGASTVVVPSFILKMQEVMHNLLETVSSSMYIACCIPKMQQLGLL